MADRTQTNECHFCTHKANVPYNTHIRCLTPDPNMVGNEHGIKKGWFHYPLLFDPVWKEKLCDNYQAKEDTL